MALGGFRHGVVIRAGQMKKTCMVAFSKLFYHPHVKRVYLKTSKVMVHDENEACDIGDKVIIRQCRPYSKNKYFILDKIIEKEGAAAILRQHPEYGKFIKRTENRF